MFFREHIECCDTIYMPKVIISFSTDADIIELMEKTLIGGMSVANTRVGFDSSLFIKNVNY